MLSRELIKETLGESTNRYKKLANINFYKDCESFECHNVESDYDIDVYKYCAHSKDLFELYKRCLSRSQIEGIINGYIHSMNALKISTHGKLFFIPKTHMHMTDILEDFIDEINKNSYYGSSATVNSMYVMSDDKQKEKMSVEFYANIRKDIEFFQDRMTFLIKSGSESKAVMERWANKVSTLEDKKKNYEEVLKRELNSLDDEFLNLRLLSQELQLRAKKLKKSA